MPYFVGGTVANGTNTGISAGESSVTVTVLDTLHNQLNIMVIEALV